MLNKIHPKNVNPVTKKALLLFFINFHYRNIHCESRGYYPSTFGITIAQIARICFNNTISLKPNHQQSWDGKPRLRAETQACL
jgi:hypothetical protein